jgi:hypothetical protein
LKKQGKTMTTTQRHFLPARVVVMPNVEKTRKNHDHHPVRIFDFFAPAHKKNQGIFHIFLPRMVLTLASRNLRRGHHVDIRLDSIKYACFIDVQALVGFQVLMLVVWILKSSLQNRIGFLAGFEAPLGLPGHRG